MPKPKYWEKGVAIMNELSKSASSAKVCGTIAYIVFLAKSGLASGALPITIK
jgi:hypothetical protein